MLAGAGRRAGALDQPGDPPARSVVERVRASIAAKDLAGLTDATEALSRTLNMFRGVVNKTAG